MREAKFHNKTAKKPVSVHSVSITSSGVSLNRMSLFSFN
jgi:uncharacterized protein YvpB